MKLSDTSPYTQNAQISPIRKELLILTKDHNHAIVLNQLLYWTLRLKDYDLFVKEEKRTGSSSDGHTLKHGWFGKPAHQLLEETLLSVSKVTLRKYINALVVRGWVTERLNPKYKWNKTLQYRVNLRTVQADLQALGWRLSGFPEDLFNPSLEGNHNESPKPNLEKSKDLPKADCEGEKNGKPQESSSFENEASNKSYTHLDS